MITLHRLVHTDEVIRLNPDLIQSVEACPDTTVRLTTGQLILVDETPDEVVEAIRVWRAQVLAEAMGSQLAVA